MRSIRPRSRSCRLASLAALLALLAAACASETPSPTPAATAAPTAGGTGPSAGPTGGFVGGPSPSAIATAGASPTLEPTPVPTIPPTPAPTPVSREPGLGWSAVATTGLDGVELRGIVATATGWLAVGRSTDPLGPPAWTSPDGATWTRAASDGSVPDGAVLHAVAAGGPGYVAVGTLPSTTTDGTPTTFAAIFHSADGSTWSIAGQLRAGNDSELRGLVATDERLVAVGRVTKIGAAAWTSTDGIAWKRSTKGFRSEPLTVMYDVAVGGRGVVAAGQGAMGAAVWTSPDGLHWRREPDGPAMHRGAMRSVVRTEGGLVAIGDNLWTSKDGLRWASVVSPSLSTPELWAATVTGDGITAVGNDRAGGATAWQSTDDGKTWRAAPRQDELAAGSLFALAAVDGDSDGGLVAVGEARGAGIVRRTPPQKPAPPQAP